MILPDTETGRLAACHECDLLVRLDAGNPAEKSVCPRCGASIAEYKRNTVDRTLALVLAGLILYLPANFLPILELNILGSTSQNTMAGAVDVLFREGLPLVGIMVFFCSMLIPLANLLLLLIVLLQVRADRCRSFVPGLFRLYIHFDSWAMLEIYLIALLVSIIKLLDMAKVGIDIGFFCLVGLILIYLLSKVTLDRGIIWERIEASCGP